MPTTPRATEAEGKTKKKTEEKRFGSRLLRRRSPSSVSVGRTSEDRTLCVRTSEKTSPNYFGG